MIDAQKADAATDVRAGTAAVPDHLVRQEFGQRLYKALLAANMRPAELARRVNLSRNNISTYTNGKSLPSHSNLILIAKVLNVKPDDLIPNYQETRVRGEAMAGFQIKSSVADPSMAWLMVNREVPIELAMEIGGMLEKWRKQSVALEVDGFAAPPRKRK